VQGCKCKGASARVQVQGCKCKGASASVHCSFNSIQYLFLTNATQAVT